MMEFDVRDSIVAMSWMWSNPIQIIAQIADMVFDPGTSNEPSERRLRTSSLVRIAVVIPSYKVTRHVIGVVQRVPSEVWRIYVVDDACPDGSGDVVERLCKDMRVVVLRNPVNLGVGGAVLHGYRRASQDGADVIVKIDGDGQMNPAMLMNFVAPVASGLADYAKGNRFYDLRNIGRMPPLRLFGNAALSFMAKCSTGYWDIFDPNNGYTAIDARMAASLPHDKISPRYFFETDMLFRLGTFRAVVIDVPMHAHYADEVSNLSIKKVAGEFLFKHVRNSFKRIFYCYFLRDVSVATFELLVGLPLLCFGASFGAYHWWMSAAAQTGTPTGTIMLAVMPIILGLQLLLAFLSYDIAAVPRLSISNRLKGVSSLADPDSDG